MRCKEKTGRGRKGEEGYIVRERAVSVDTIYDGSRCSVGKGVKEGGRCGSRYSVWEGRKYSVRHCAVVESA
jgi:hypothetical protein